jgi:hypothetical protein
MSKIKTNLVMMDMFFECRRGLAAELARLTD